MSNVKELNVNNTTYDIIGKGVVDQNNPSAPLKQWTGTKAQYDSIVSKDANTIYNITDDASSSNYANTDLSNLSLAGQNVLNEKANIDMDNLSLSGKSNVMDLRMPDYTLGVEYTSNASGVLAYDAKVVIQTSMQSYNSARFVVYDSNNNIVDDLRAYGKTFSDNLGIGYSMSGIYQKGVKYDITMTNGGGSTGSHVFIYPLKGNV